jgi:hypothetical protein
MVYDIRTALRLSVAVCVYCFCIACLWPNPTAAAEFTHPTLGYSITYPDAWTVSVTSQPDLVSLLSPGYPRAAGTNMPPGFADITIQVLPGVPSNDLALDSLYRPQGSRSAYSVNGQEGKRLEYVWDPSVQHPLKFVAIALRPSDKQFLIQLDYHTDDPKAAEYVQVLGDVVSSLTVPGR